MRQMPGVQELKRGGCGAFGRLRSDHEKKIAPLTEIRSPMAERFRNTALVPLLRTNPDDSARKNRNGVARDVFASGMVPDEPPRANPYRKLKQKIKEQKSSSLSKLRLFA